MIIGNIDFEAANRHVTFSAVEQEDSDEKYHVYLQTTVAPDSYNREYLTHFRTDNLDEDVKLFVDECQDFLNNNTARMKKLSDDIDPTLYWYINTCPDGWRAWPDGITDEDKIRLLYYICELDAECYMSLRLDFLYKHLCFNDFVLYNPHGINGVLETFVIRRTFKKPAYLRPYAIEFLDVAHQRLEPIRAILKETINQLTPFVNNGKQSRKQ